MRTTVKLDQEVYELATLYSKGKGLTLGEALSELAKKGIESLQAVPSASDSVPPGLVRAPNGLLMFAPRADGRVITNEMVKEALEEDDY
ncbi:MAG: hypothetical protein ABR976_18445 [Terracidiphilus sp.]|jgi:hypothetical protein